MDCDDWLSCARGDYREAVSPRRWNVINQRLLWLYKVVYSVEIEVLHVLF